MAKTCALFYYRVASRCAIARDKVWYSRQVGVGGDCLFSFSASCDVTVHSSILLAAIQYQMSC